MRQTDFVILGLLQEEPLTGYQIKQYIDIRFRYFWSESYGQIYPALKSLQEKGFIEEAARESPQNRSQKTYRILPEGLTALHDWLAQPVATETVRLEILLKMYFSHLVSEDVMIGHLNAFREAHEKDLATIRVMGEQLKAILDQDPNHPHVLRVVDFGERVNEAYLAWAEETVNFLESRKEK